ncbi:hypothetical protein FB567DRAFT_133599 [Paraphoma chrysanthemicola]|uniref:Uncharacterized protein n=1 Tax=Paraphoma chrysanthemicola TaxID=798071 RepID=A0A8K0QXH0_9PLEO|nr:hypothetical protein FB567DRAFT_133599 [Paraphoma chrysanthemicola]
MYLRLDHGRDGLISCRGRQGLLVMMPVRMRILVLVAFLAPNTVDSINSTAPQQSTHSFIINLAQPQLQDTHAPHTPLAHHILLSAGTPAGYLHAWRNGCAQTCGKNVRLGSAQVREPAGRAWGGVLAVARGGEVGLLWLRRILVFCDVML